MVHCSAKIIKKKLLKTKHSRVVFNEKAVDAHGQGEIITYLYGTQMACKWEVNGM